MMLPVFPWSDSACSSSAVQIAKARGARVIAMAALNHDAPLHAFGADESVDYHGAHAEDALKKRNVV